MMIKKKIEMDEQMICFSKYKTFIINSDLRKLHA